LSGCLTKQVTKVLAYDPKVKPHVANAGSMIEDMEIDLRYQPEFLNAPL
jgi:hypothetical protein